MYFIFWYDYVLLPFYLIAAVIYLNVYFRRRHGADRELKRYFNTGLALKLFGCVAIGLIYEHYYQGAYDGRFFFKGGKVLTDYWIDHPGEFFHVLTHGIIDFNQTNLEGIDMMNSFIFTEGSFTVCKVVGLFNFLSFDAFLPCSIFFCVAAYIAVWRLFIFLRTEFLLAPRIAAFCTIYIPSVIIWDASIFKDTITFSALCWLFMCAYYVFIRPQSIARNALGMLFAMMMIAVTKVYILGAFIPAFMAYVFTSYKARIPNQLVRMVLTPAMLSLAGGATIILLTQSEDLLGIYSLDRVLETTNTTYSNIQQYGGRAGSSYELDVNFTSTTGIIAAIPVGINLTLFRPYPWEYLSPIILLASAESMIVIYFTLLVLFKVGLFRALRMAYSSPPILFSLLFSLTFAFLVGLSAANFGTLVRYKIPCLPFYFLALALLYQSRLGFVPATAADAENQAPEAGEASTSSSIPR